MAIAELHYATIRELGEAFRRRTLSPVELLEALLARIEKLDPMLRAFVTLTGDRARMEAQAAESAFRRGDRTGPLVGIPDERHPDHRGFCGPRRLGS
jgi:Asp-tRNA(Asn)/Glu-tRNA(Gln) amidotransferase A subunit family amidase